MSILAKIKKGSFKTVVIPLDSDFDQNEQLVVIPSLQNPTQKSQLVSSNKFQTDPNQIKKMQATSPYEDDESDFSLNRTTEINKPPEMGKFINIQINKFY